LGFYRCYNLASSVMHKWHLDATNSI
jgi:hypothetical protein